MFGPDDLAPADEQLLDLLREGRVTAPYAANETGYSLQYVRDRLARLLEHGHVEKVYEGLYELVDDPADADVNQNTVPDTESTNDADTELTDETHRVADAEAVTETDPGDNDADARPAVWHAVERVAEGWNDTPERLAARKEAAAAALEYAVATGKAVGKSDAIEWFRDNYPVEGQSAETWWRKNVRPVLSKYGEYSNADHGYCVTEDDLLDSDTEEDNQ